MRLILTSNCQTLVAVARIQTVFFEMFLNVAHYNRSSFRKYSLCKLSTAVQDLNQHAILHNTSISNMKFIPHTHSCIHQSGLQKGFVTFNKRTDIYKRNRCTKEKYKERQVLCDGEREREREREREGGGMGRNQQKAQARGLRSDRQEPGGSN